MAEDGETRKSLLKKQEIELGLSGARTHSGSKYLLPEQMQTQDRKMQQKSQLATYENRKRDSVPASAYRERSSNPPAAWRGPWSKLSLHLYNMHVISGKA